MQDCAGMLARIQRKVKRMKKVELLWLSHQLQCNWITGSFHIISAQLRSTKAAKQGSAKAQGVWHCHHHRVNHDLRVFGTTNLSQKFSRFALLQRPDQWPDGVADGCGRIDVQKEPLQYYAPMIVTWRAGTHGSQLCAQEAPWTGSNRQTFQTLLRSTKGGRKEKLWNEANPCAQVLIDNEMLHLGTLHRMHLEWHNVYSASATRHNKT